MARNIYSFHSDPAVLVGYEQRLAVPALLFRDLEIQASDPKHNKKISDFFEQHRSTLGKDLDVALRVSEIYTQQKDKNFWPVGGEVEMALLRSPRHRADYIKYEIGFRLQHDPRYIDILRQLDPVFVAQYLGGQERLHYYVNPDFKHTVLEMLRKDIPASIIYSAESKNRNTLIEPVLLRMSEDKWQDLAKSSSQLQHYSITRRTGPAAYYKTAWQYYLRCLNSQGVRNAISDARSAGFSQAGWIESDGQN